MVLVLRHIYLILVILFPIFILLTYLSTFSETEINAVHSFPKNDFTWIKDYNKLANLPFSFEILPTVCAVNQTMMIILIFTAPENFQRRRILRDTWMSNDSGVKMYFLLGRTENATVSEQLAEENDTHRDFIQGSFLDTYRNLSYKHIMSLKFMFYHCRNVEYLVKVDDDTIVNAKRLMAFLRQRNQVDAHSKRIMCEVRVDHPVLRFGKWEVSREDYSKDTYPPHCAGFAIIYPRDAIAALYVEAQREQHVFWIDDVYITGFVAEKSRVGHVNITERMFISPGDIDYSLLDVPPDFLMAGFNIDEKNMRYLSNLVKETS